MVKNLGIFSVVGIKEENDFLSVVEKNNNNNGAPEWCRKEGHYDSY